MIDELEQAFIAMKKEWGYRDDICILATHIAIDALGYFGVEAKPLSVAVEVYNPRAYELISAGRPGSEITVANGCHLVGIDPDIPAPGQGFNGHLVTYLPKTQEMIDLTLDQTTRPHKNILTTPLAGVLPDFFWEGEAVSFEMNGCLVAYKNRPELKSVYRTTPDWTKSVKEQVGFVIRHMKATSK